MALLAGEATSGAISMATAGQVRLSNGGRKVRPRIVGIPACPSAELISEVSLRLRVTHPACAVRHGRIAGGAPVGGASDEV